MTGALTAVLEFLAVCCLVFVAAIGALFTRRVTIRRRGGTFDCSLRLTPLPPLRDGTRTAVPSGRTGYSDSAQGPQPGGERARPPAAAGTGLTTTGPATAYRSTALRTGAPNRAEPGCR